MNDRKLDLTDTLESLKNGDLHAFEAIYDLFKHKVLNLSLKYSLTKEDAEEVLQDVFIKVWNTRDSIDLNKKFDNLIFTICKNCILDRIKHIKRTEQKHQQNYLFRKSFFPQNTTESEIHFSDLKNALSFVLDELPPKRRQIFELNKLHGYSYQQIANKLNISMGTVEKQMSKALHVVRNKLIHYYIYFICISQMFL